MLRRLQIAALILGVTFFAYLLYEIGPGTILSDLGTIGWGLAVLILLELLLDAVNTLGWRFTFPPEERHVSFSTLYLIRLAGTAFNQAVPSATVGGEPVKVILLRPHLSVSSGVASVVTAKVAYGVAQAIFVLVGLGVVFWRFELPAVVSRALLGALALTLAGLALFFWLQHRGLFASVARTARTFCLTAVWVEKLRGSTTELDQRIRDFYTIRRTDFALSVAWHLASFGIGLLQVFLLLRWLDLPADLATCFAIEAFSLLVQLTMFLVPASIGVQEGGKLFIFTVLGLPVAAGLSVGIAFRLTQIACVALGFAAFVFLQWRQRVAGAERRSSTLGSVIGPHASAYYGLGRVARTRARQRLDAGETSEAAAEFARARAAFDAALAIYPRHYLSHFALAGVLYQTGDIGGAVDHYRRVVELAGDTETGRDAAEALRQLAAAGLTSP